MGCRRRGHPDERRRGGALGGTDGAHLQGGDDGVVNGFALPDGVPDSALCALREINSSGNLCAA